MRKNKITLVKYKRTIIRPFMPILSLIEIEVGSSTHAVIYCTVMLKQELLTRVK